MSESFDFRDYDFFQKSPSLETIIGSREGSSLPGIADHLMLLRKQASSRLYNDVFEFLSNRLDESESGDSLRSVVLSSELLQRYLDEFDEACEEGVIKLDFEGQSTPCGESVQDVCLAYRERLNKGFNGFLLVEGVAEGLSDDFIAAFNQLSLVHQKFILDASFKNLKLSPLNPAQLENFGRIPEERLPFLPKILGLNDFLNQNWFEDFLSLTNEQFVALYAGNLWAATHKENFISNVIKMVLDLNVDPFLLSVLDFKDCNLEDLRFVFENISLLDLILKLPPSFIVAGIEVSYNGRIKVADFIDLLGRRIEVSDTFLICLDGDLPEEVVVSEELQDLITREYTRSHKKISVETVVWFSNLDPEVFEWMRADFSWVCSVDCSVNILDRCFKRFQTVDEGLYTFKELVSIFMLNDCFPDECLMSRDAVEFALGRELSEDDKSHFLSELNAVLGRGDLERDVELCLRFIREKVESQKGLIGLDINFVSFLKQFQGMEACSTFPRLSRYIECILPGVNPSFRRGMNPSDAHYLREIGYARSSFFVKAYVADLFDFDCPSLQDFDPYELLESRGNSSRIFDDMGNILRLIDTYLTESDAALIKRFAWSPAKVWIFCSAVYLTGYCDPHMIAWADEFSCTREELVRFMNSPHFFDVYIFLRAKYSSTSRISLDKGKELLKNGNFDELVVLAHEEKVSALSAVDPSLVSKEINNTLFLAD